MKKVTAILIGAGDRGMNAYGGYSLKNPDEIQFIAVADINEKKRRKFQELHNIPDDMCFEDWRSMLDKPKFADAVFICTNESFHYEPTLKAVENGYHILLEKPITTKPHTSMQIGELAENFDKTFMLCYVLRYTPFFFTLKKLIDDGKIGRLRGIQHSENVGMAHYSHSYVRGVYSKSENAGPMLLSKSCHDMDIINWLVGSKCKKVSSFASQSWFNKANAPEGVPDRCTEGCPISENCYFYAPRMYFRENSGFSSSVISIDQSPEAKMEALKTGPFGRCVYKCDNDVVDQQVINLEYENGVTVGFTMNSYTFACDRRIKIMGTEGEIRGHLGTNEIEVYSFSSGNKEVYHINTVQDRHGGGDYFIMKDFVKMVQTGAGNNRTAVKDAVMSHIMAFAAEKSRKEGKVIVIDEYMDELRKIIY